ncbi:TetR family transcriptional regulator C-terminal domain-containing protein [Psychroflexus maritimus]|uniref:TetR/AcrR family transcriptional regulator n=1 Tax=Psychroflexus maritimus TaxID=2714865 RepID=A0A967AAY7_9FLAO|nr:TetR family transcriptional regulator C-terminal domain-containing protein [Psychroflexus maritimus]NGZ88691.1 TetR/AcrR family transcriptional regulator [Psychroflexus maritimus]
MATKTKPKKKKMTQEDYMSSYMDYVLTHERKPKSVFKFCKDLGVEESDFYQNFGSFEGLRNKIWEHFYHNASNLMNANEEVMQYESREKMLTFFFTFFEILTANRSYVIYVLDEHEDMMKNLSQLKGLRKNIKSFAQELIAEDNDEKKFNFLKNSEKVFSEGAWIQFLFLLKFWKDDQSPGFEKTDVAIEKSVNTVFDVFDNTPLEKVFDFGKFLYKEQMGK